MSGGGGNGNKTKSYAKEKCKVIVSGDQRKYMGKTVRGKFKAWNMNVSAQLFEMSFASRNPSWPLTEDTQNQSTTSNWQNMFSAFESGLMLRRCHHCHLRMHSCPVQFNYNNRYATRFFCDLFECDRYESIYNLLFRVMHVYVRSDSEFWRMCGVLADFASRSRIDAKWDFVEFYCFMCSVFTHGNVTHGVLTELFFVRRLSSIPWHWLGRLTYCLQFALELLACGPNIYKNLFFHYFCCI